ncbi:MAG TPA: hypothetical protein DDZ80_32280 [Cyanobacteria bacterium UBA8803]|nr:hypothetical protein [Cyanobacteria bacterium UBA9273]HBL62880.1 hypothetical protein [Cyanobacteria bacterium UBA8803]
MFLGSAEVTGSGIFKWNSSNLVTAQVARSQDVWRQVYQRLPNFPLENNYLSKETGEVVADETLVSRIIRYHLYVKNRLPYFRFDWKLTLADYLGANDSLVASQYPGNTTLKENPLAGDRAAIEKLSRAERNALIDVLISLFNPNRPQTPAPTPSVSEPPPSANPRTTPRFPKPGDAELLRP